MLKKISYNVSTLFGLGFINFMPGTFGSLIGLFSGILISTYAIKSFFIIQFVVILVISTILLNKYQKDTNKEDSSDIIIDEYIGQQIPFIFFEVTMMNIILFFISFRFFDIIKIFPANYIDRKYKNCIGVMLDDIIAGSQSVVLIFIINFYLL